MKKLFTLFFALVATTSLWAYHHFEVGGIYYNHLGGNNVEVTYRGDYVHSYDNEYAGEVIIPSTVTYNGTTYSVTSIGDYAFHSCYSLTSITIGNSVTSIGEEAFAYCFKLTSITIGNSVTSIGNDAFDGCSNITSVEWNAKNCKDFFNESSTPFYSALTQITSFIIGDSVQYIPSYLCYDMNNLTSITIGNSVTSIGYKAFFGCSSLPVENNLRYADTYLVEAVDKTLSTYSIKEGTKWIGDYAFYGCSSLTSITIPNSVTSIGRYAFYDCSSLTSVTIPNSVTGSITSSSSSSSASSIGDYAFEDCSSLTSITIPNSVTSIGDRAFYDCSSLTSVTIPNSVTSIGGNTFYGCSSLTSVSIPNSVTYIGDEAFRGCSSLTSIIIPENITNIGTGVFVSCASLTSVVWNAKNCVDFFTGSDAEIGTFSTLFFENSRTPSDNGPIVSITVCPITSVVFGDEVESIPAYLCCGLRRLTSITIPNSVTSIGNYAFSWCSSLTSVTIGNSVTSIGRDAFRDCSALTSITIPNSVTSIGDGAFYYCSSLDTLTCLAMTPPALGGYVFDGCDNPTLFVPCAALSDYQLHELWRRQFTTIECISSEEVDTEDVIIESGTTTVIITWPTEDGADTYTIVIKKDGEVVCTLTFNSEGQLLNIAFAPGRDGNHPAQYAEAAANSYRFTVTGLEEGTDYTYDITVKDASNKTIKSHSGKFTTESLTAVENTHIQSQISNCQKILRDGQLLILRDGVEYNAMGQEL